MAAKTGPKAPRNKVERVLLIQGKPDFLYEIKPQTYYSVKETDGKITPIGKVGDHVVKLLAKIPGAEIIKEKKEEKRTKRPTGYGIKSIQQSGSGDTTVHISAPTEEELLKRIEVFEEFSLKNGYDIQERCLWVCKVDSKYPKGQEKTPVDNVVNISDAADVRDVSNVHKKKPPGNSKEKTKARIGKTEFVLEETPESFQQLVASKLEEKDTTPVPVATPVIKVMSDKTRSLQEMALKIMGNK